MHWKHMTTAAVLLSWHASAMAQDDDAEADAKGRIMGIVAEASVANGPNDRELKTSNEPEFQLVAGEGNGRASLSWSYKFDRGENGFTQLSTTLSAPLNEDGDTELFGLKGFPGGTQIKLGFSHYSGKFEERARAEIIDAGGFRAMSESDLGARTSDCIGDWEVLGAAEANDLCTGREDTRIRATNVRSARVQEMRRVLLNNKPPSRIFFFGGEFTANRKDFKFLDQALFRSQTESKFGYGGSIFGGFIWPKSGASVTASVSHARGYEAATAVTICQPISPPPLSQCITGPGGPPTRARASIAALDLRYEFKTGLGLAPNMAIAPALNVDLRDGAYSVDVPIYLVQDDKDKLRGGVRLGYVNSKAAGGGRDGDFSIGLFVGAPFTLHGD